MMSKNSIVPFLKDYLIKFLTRPFLLDTNEIPKKVNTKINTRITSNRGHRNRYEDAVVPPYGRMRGRATAALPPHIHLLQACDPARMQEGYKAKDKKESSTHREHPLQGNSSHRHSRPSGNKDTRGNGDKCGESSRRKTK